MCESPLSCARRWGPFWPKWRHSCHLKKKACKYLRLAMTPRVISRVITCHTCHLVGEAVGRVTGWIWQFHTDKSPECRGALIDKPEALHRLFERF